MLSEPFTLPVFDPIAFTIGPLAIRWYALAYIAGFVLGWRLALRLADKTPSTITGAPTRTDYDDFLSWAIIGVILGGRIGYVLFYNLQHFIMHPAEIFAVWQGGMSFHGGLLGLVAAGWWFTTGRKLNKLAFGDVICTVAPLGLGLGRITNFINGELVGRITTSPFGVIFPTVDANPRHASQLYQAALEGFLLFAIMMLCARSQKIRARPGLLMGIFFVGYAIFRTIGELFRAPDIQLGFILGEVTMGQILCIPMLLAGLWLILHANRRAQPAA